MKKEEEIMKKCYTCKYSSTNNENGKRCDEAYPKIYYKCNPNFSEWQPINKETKERCL